MRPTKNDQPASEESIPSDLDQKRPDHRGQRPQESFAGAVDYQDFVESLKTGYPIKRTKQKNLKKQLLVIARQLHVFSSSLLLFLMLGFSLTGWLLNHQDWFSGSGEEGALTLPLSAVMQETFAKVAESGELPLKELEHFVSSRFNLSSPSEVEWDREYSEVVLSYKIPAGYATAVFSYDLQEFQLQYREGSIWTIMNDLHKGRNSGAAWGWLIDLSAFLMIFFSLTGLAILWQNKKTKKTAVLMLIAGVIVPVSVYFVWVPHIVGV